MTKIVVSKNGESVFTAESGRLGRNDSAELDFLIFASEIIGATYSFFNDAVNRLSTMGYVVEAH